MTYRRRAAWQPRRAADARHLAQAAVYALLATPVLAAAAGGVAALFVAAMGAR